jgi:hypothetical protein
MHLWSFLLHRNIFTQNQKIVKRFFVKYAVEKRCYKLIFESLSPLTPNSFFSIVAGTSREVAGTSREVAGTSREVAGTFREVAGISREVAGMSREVAGISREVAGTFREVAGISREVAGTSREVSKSRFCGRHR